MTNRLLKERVSRFLRSAWLFPALLLILLIILTTLRLNGSSIGVFYQKLFGDQKDSSLIAGEPRAIRSDEWEVNTPLLFSQVSEGFPKLNTTIGHGQDISATIDVPYLEWSSVFKPQNWSFFVLPPEFAFAFKWWFLAVLLMLAAYVFSLALLPKKYLLSALLAVLFFCSPFVHWWYQSSTILPLAYGLLIAGITVHLLRAGEDKKKKLLFAGALFYTATSFALVLYVPFILPVGVVLGAFLLGHIINTLRDDKKKKRAIQNLRWIIAPILVALGVFVLYLKTRSSVIEAISQSVYPGQRVETSGKFDIKQLFGGYFNLQLQDTDKASRLNLNQSEASNFILLFPFLIPLYVYLFIKRRLLKISIDWRVVALSIVTLVFLVRLFVPASEALFSLLQLNRIPHNRLLIGFGFLNFLWLVLAVQQLSTLKKKLPALLGAIAAGTAFITVTIIGFGLKVNHTGYMESSIKIVFIGLLISFGVWLLYKKRFAYGLGLIALFSVASVAGVNPLYHGLGILTDSKVASTIRTIGDEKGNWVVGNDAAFLENIPPSQGLRSLSGVYAYPQLKVWESLGTDPETKAVYNRYAHVFFSVENINKPEIAQGAYFDPPALDAFRVHADVCSPFLRQQNVRYVLVSVPIESSCAKKIETISYPLLKLSVYELTY